MRTLPAILIGLAGALGAFTSHAAPAQGFELSSPDIAPGSIIKQAYAFNGFGCTGQNTSPATTWRNPPAGTRSFAVMVHDPDAPTGGAGFWHWVVVDIPATATALSRGVGTPDGRKLPGEARQIATDFGTPGWGGPCPPVGDKPHRYVFTVYALKVDRLELPANATASPTGVYRQRQCAKHASFSALYGR